MDYKLSKHIPVLLNETIKELELKNEGTFVDATLGGGGHTLKILSNFESSSVKNANSGNTSPELKAQSSKLLCFDHDLEAINRFKQVLLEKNYKQVSKNRFEKGGVKVILRHSNFAGLNEILEIEKIKKVDGIIADLGISTDQLEDTARGFSYQKGEQLDLRMDQRITVTGSDLLNGLYKGELIKLFKIYGDIENAKRIAEEVIRFRQKQKIETVSDLKQIIKKAVNLKSSRNLFARVIQTLRIAVNQELSSLQQFLPQAFESLAKGCSLCVITFHSGEDRIVKNFYKEQVKNNLAQSDLIYPTDQEIGKNPKASSAKLRILKKTVAES
jgi:16S rRNA (cytosine1402-N4)-methyltransferase